MPTDPRKDDPWNGQLSLFDDDARRQPPLGRNVLVFDLETQRSFEEVGGRDKTHLLGMSLSVVYSFANDSFQTYWESDVQALAARLAEAELVVGFNLLGFDYQVLKGYVDMPFHSFPTLDLMLDLQEKLGFRPKLEAVLQASLQVGKSADGLQALTWYREGRLDLIEHYCREDVRLTRDLYLFGRRNRYVLVSRYGKSPHKVAVDW